MPDYPLLLRPHLAERVWGGSRLGPGIGEAWDLSVHPHGPSVIANGALAGRSLADVDPAAFGGPIRLLAKRLDCAQDLSVQVHPRAGDQKTEAWVVLDAAPGAGVYCGFERAVSREEVRRAAGDGTLPDLLHFRPTPAGDTVFVRSGVVHAIGGGLFLFEIQQSADTTYRLYDWGRGRDLHLDEALDQAELGPCAPTAPGRHLLECEHFFVDRAEAACELDPGGAWVALLVLEGSGQVGDTTVAAGQTVLLPTAAGCRAWTPGAGAHGLIFGPPVRFLQ